MLNRNTLLFITIVAVAVAVVLTPAIAQEDEGNVVEGSEVSGDIIIDDDATLAEDIFGLEGGDFVTDAPVVNDETSETTTTSGAPTGKYTIQVFATYSMGKAGEISDKVKSKLSGAETFIAKEGGTYKVRVGSYISRSDADRQRDKLRTLGFHDAWVVTFK